MKLSKPELKLQKETIKLLENEKLTSQELEQFYTDFNPGFISDVTTHSAYFTPLDMAYDFALMVPTHGILVDMCAGIGVLTHTAKIRDTYHQQIKQHVCIERNPDYIEIGKKLCPYADWIQGDIFDKNVWDAIKKKYGQIDCVISNPPFGKVSKSDADRSWLKYQGTDIDIASIEIAMQNAKQSSFILPQGSCTFRGSGRPFFEHVENRKIDKLKKETGTDFYMAWASIDTTVYEQFKNTKIVVECCTIVDVEGD